MRRFLVVLIFILSFPGCSSAKKDADGADSKQSTGQDARPAEAQPSSVDDDDSSGSSDDDDSAGSSDDDDSANTATRGQDSAAAGLGAADRATARPPVAFVPPPPGKRGVLERAAMLMMGTRFRWVQGSKDVAYGLYGAPVMLNVWSCTDKKIDTTLEWMTLMEKTYSDQMLSILVPANVAERSLTGQDNLCGRSVRFGRSLGIDVGKGVMKELSVDELPTTLIFNSQGVEVARHEGPLSTKSLAATKLRSALEREMGPVAKGQALAP